MSGLNRAAVTKPVQFVALRLNASTGCEVNLENLLQERVVEGFVAGGDREHIVAALEMRGEPDAVREESVPCSGCRSIQNAPGASTRRPDSCPSKAAEILS